MCAQIYIEMCQDHAALWPWMILFQHQTVQGNLKLRLWLQHWLTVCVILHEKIYFEAVFTLDCLPLRVFVTCSKCVPPPCCYDIGLDFCLCVAACRLMTVISIRGTQILYSFSYFPSELALCSCLTSLSVQ